MAHRAAVLVMALLVSAALQGAETAWAQPGNFCADAKMTMSITSGPIGTKSIITGTGWAPGGTVSVRLPYGSPGIFHVDVVEANAPVGTDGGWQLTETAAEPTPAGDYTFTATQDTPQCPDGKIEKSVTFTVTPAAAPSQPQKCEKVIFIGLRGSGENPPLESEYNMGPTVYRVFEEFISRANSAGVEWEGVGVDAPDYPAASVPSLMEKFAITGQFPSVTAGTTGLLNRFEEAVADKTACIALVGYSQGAWVIGKFVEQIGDNYRNRISAILLFGDPRFVPTPTSPVPPELTDPAAKSPVPQGSLATSGALRFFGLDNGHYYENMADRVRSYCHERDPVCNFFGTQHPDTGSCLDVIARTVACRHLFYIPGFSNGLTSEGTEFLGQKLLGQ